LEVGSRIVVETADGSCSLFVPELNEHYHSAFGAVTESRHVFIEAGFRPACEKPGPVNILEVGFGTGLNALLTIAEAERLLKEVNYTAIEPFPVDITIIDKLNYTEAPDLKKYAAAFSILHLASSIQHQKISHHFIFEKINSKIEEYNPPPATFGLVYFDAFAPDKQPEMWTGEIFRKIHESMIPGAILVTYCVKGEVVRRLKALGFSIEKLPGPPGKRHMLRAVKS
jgi:tRNA U34 5-methylaminomethyl-2-thiouridine-forming methyltransferase MnmC